MRRVLNVPATRLMGIALLLMLASAYAQIQVPVLSRPVTDLTNTLSTRQISRLENKIKAFEATHGSQLAVLLVATTQPEDIAQFGIRVADAWKLGREQEDDGVILIVAKADRKVRLEVGYGLEGAIPDAIAKRIIEDVVSQHFKQGHYFAGIETSIDRLMPLIAGEQLPTPKQAKPTQQNTAFLSILFTTVVFGHFLALLTGKLWSALLSAVAAFVAGMVLFSLSWLMALWVGLMVFVMLAVRPPRSARWSSGVGMGGLGRGGGRWRGGGGGFGGGGASGSW